MDFVRYLLSLFMKHVSVYTLLKTKYRHPQDLSCLVDQTNNDDNYNNNDDDAASTVIKCG